MLKSTPIGDPLMERGSDVDIDAPPAPPMEDGPPPPPPPPMEPPSKVSKVTKMSIEKKDEVKNGIPDVTGVKLRRTVASSPASSLITADDIAKVRLRKATLSQDKGAPVQNGLDLKEIQNFKLKKSTHVRSPGGTPRRKETSSTSPDEKTRAAAYAACAAPNNSNGTTLQAFAALRKKFYDSPRGLELLKKAEATTVIDKENLMASANMHSCWAPASTLPQPLTSKPPIVSTSSFISNPLPTISSPPSTLPPLPPSLRPKTDTNSRMRIIVDTPGSRVGLRTPSLTSSIEKVSTLSNRNSHTPSLLASHDRC